MKLSKRSKKVEKKLLLLNNSEYEEIFYIYFSIIGSLISVLNRCRMMIK